MNEFVIALGWAGLYGVMALAAIGSIIGCAVAGQAAIGAMVDTESGYGRYIGVSVIGQVLLKAGYRVGIVAQPDMKSDKDIAREHPEWICKMALMSSNCCGVSSRVV